MPVNGSSATGHCASITTADLGSRVDQNCSTPETSVLFDGTVPTLVNLDGGMWADQLLTVNRTDIFRVEISADFTGKSGIVERIEVVMFNCPEWGIEVRSITINRASFPTTDTEMISGQTINVPSSLTSCKHLVRVCMPVSINISESPFLALRFRPMEAEFVHIAEVRFDANSTCLPDGLVETEPAQSPVPSFTTGKA